MNLAIISDTHCGSNFALCPPEDKIQVSENKFDVPNPLQETIIKMWFEYWDWIDTKSGGDFSLVLNGDPVDGNYHQSYARMTDEILYQKNMVVSLLEPIKYKKLYIVKGTSAHDGLSGTYSQGIAMSTKLNVTPDSDGNKAPYGLRLRFPNKALVDIRHHGRISMPANKPNLLYNEWVNNVVSRVLVGYDPPHMVVRSHGHEWKSSRVASNLTEDVSIMTPGWQALTPWAHKTVSARNAIVNIGGILLTIEDGKVCAKAKYWNVETEGETKL